MKRNIIGCLVIGFLLTVLYSFDQIKRYGNKKETVKATVYERDGDVHTVDLSVQYFKHDSILDLTLFQGALKGYKGEKKFKIKPALVEKLTFTLFGEPHVFYSHTDRLKRLYYFFHAENEGDFMVLKRQSDHGGGSAPMMMGTGAPGAPVHMVHTYGGRDIHSYYSIIRKGEDHVADFQAGRLEMFLEEYLKDDCPQLMEQLKAGAFKTKGSKEGMYLKIADFYNVTCGK